MSKLPDPDRSASHTPLQLVSRIGAGVLGGYAFCWGFIALSIGLLFAAKMEFHDAESLSTMLGFLLFLVVFLWAFSTRSLWRTWLVLAGGGGLMTGAAFLVQRSII